MSGLIGFVGLTPHTLNDVAREVNDRLCRFPWSTWDWWISADGTLGLGRVDIGIFNLQPQPVSSADGQVVVLLSGELYRTAELRHELEASGAVCQRGDDPELVLHAYLSLGPDFINQLEGAFHLAILDLRHQELLLANDRFGLRPLYYTQYKGKFAFAPEVKALTVDPHFEKQLSLVAVAEYMRFQQLLGEKTFFEGIQLLPPASVLRYDLRQATLQIDAYWSFAEIPRLPAGTPYPKVVEESARLFQQAVDTLSSDAKQVGLYLSGGLDSRLIAGCLAKNHASFPTITYGDPQSADVQYAARIATCLGTDHHFFEFTDGSWVLDCVDLHLELTEGHHSWIHSHGMSTLAFARELFDVNLTGLTVDTLLGPYLPDTALVAAPDHLAFLCRLFVLANQRYTWPGVTESEEYTLYTEPWRENLQNLALESLTAEMRPAEDWPPDRKVDYFKVVHHNRRMTGNYVIFNSSHFENRFPAYDYRLFDFVASLPMHMRQHRRLEQRIIESIDRRLALIPQAKDGLIFSHAPIARVSHHIITRLKQRFNRHISRVFFEPKSLYADYENWLRGGLRPWAEDLLFDGRLAARGIFNPAAVRSLFDRHMSGDELHTIGKLAPIMTLEMVLREYFDDSPGAAQ